MGIAVNSSGYVSQASQIADGVITWAKMLGTDVGHGNGHITILPTSYSSVEQGTWALDCNASRMLLSSFYNSSNANGDGLNFAVYLPVGTYTLVFYGDKSTDSAIVKFKLDGTTIATMDMYNAGGLTFNTRNTESSIAVTTAGLKNLQMINDGKNAGSSNYVNRATVICLYRTA